MRVFMNRYLYHWFVVLSFRYVTSASARSINQLQSAFMAGKISTYTDTSSQPVAFLYISTVEPFFKCIFHPAIEFYNMCHLNYYDSLIFQRTWHICGNLSSLWDHVELFRFDVSCDIFWHIHHRTFYLFFPPCSWFK